MVSNEKYLSVSTPSAPPQITISEYRQKIESSRLDQSQIKADKYTIGFRMLAETNFAFSAWVFPLRFVTTDF